MLTMTNQLTDGQKQVVQSFNSMMFHTGELQNVLRRAVQALFTDNEQDATAFIEQVLKEGTFSNKVEKQTFKRAVQRAVVALYNNLKGLEIVRNNVTLRAVKADEMIGTRGEIKTKPEKKEQDDKPADKPTDQTQTIEGLKASISKADDTIDALQADVDKSVSIQNNLADEIDRKDEEIERLKAEVERLQKESAGNLEAYQRLVEGVRKHSKSKALLQMIN